MNRSLPETHIEGLTRKRGMNRKTAHAYNKEFEGEYAQVRDAIVVEATCLGYSEPHITKRVSSFVGEMMMNMSLVSFSYGDNPIFDLKNKIRHIYDLNRLLSQEELLRFFRSKEFEYILLKVAQDDVNSYKNNNNWLKYHPVRALIFANPENLWKDMKSLYESEFSKLVYGFLPNEVQLLNTLKIIQKRISSISWNVHIEGEY